MSEDIRGLRAYLSQLIGEPFLFVRESYGDELTFHFGREVASPPIRGRSFSEGTYILNPRASIWSAKSAAWDAFLCGDAIPSTAATLVTLGDLERTPPITIGDRIDGVEVRVVSGIGIELALRFGDDSVLWVQPCLDPDDPTRDLADWELFTPYQHWIKAGPGVIWEYAESDRIPGSSSTPLRPLDRLR